MSSLNEDETSNDLFVSIFEDSDQFPDWDNQTTLMREADE